MKCWTCARPSRQTKMPSTAKGNIAFMAPMNRMRSAQCIHMNRMRSAHCIHMNRMRSAHCIYMNRMCSAHCIHMNRMRRRIVFIWITMRLWIRIRRRWIGIRRRIPIHMNKDTPAHPIPMNSNTPAYPYSYEYRYAKGIGNHKRHVVQASVILYLASP